MLRLNMNEETDMLGRFIAGALVLMAAPVPNASFYGEARSNAQSPLASACGTPVSQCVSTFPLMADASTDRFFAVLLGH